MTCARELHIPELRVDIIGFTVKDKKPDLNRWLKLLDVDADTPVKSEPARNQESESALSHVGLKVSWGKFKTAQPRVA
jgi:hypothetical protein